MTSGLSGSGWGSEKKICMTEVIAFEQQWLAKPLGQGVGKAIAEIQRSTMPPLAKLRESQTSQFSLTAINTDDLNLGCSQKAI